MYRTIGKATFLRDDQGAIKERLQALIKNGQALHKALLEKKTGLEAELSAAEQRQDELREKLEKIGI